MSAPIDAGAVQASLARWIEAGTAPSTRRAHARDVDYFWLWAAAALGLLPHYPVATEVVLQFVLDHLGHMTPAVEERLLARGVKRPGAHRVSTLQRRLASLSVAHATRGVANPCRSPQVRLLLRKAQRALGAQGPRRKRAITGELLERLVATCDDSLRGIRDRALLLVAFAAGGRRRSEIAGLAVADLTPCSDGYVLHLRRSKTDQMGKGHQVPILGAAARALEQWLAAADIREGRLFRAIDRAGQLGEGMCERTITRIVKGRAALAGLEERHYSAHSLRAGFITEAGRRGIFIGDVMQFSGHKSLEIALQYYRVGETLRNPARHLLDEGERPV